MALPKIPATHKAAKQAAQMALAMNIKEAEVVEQAMSLLWEKHIDDIRAFLGSIDEGTALFNGNDTLGGNELVEQK